MQHCWKRAMRRSAYRAKCNAHARCVRADKVRSSDNVTVYGDSTLSMFNLHIYYSIHVCIYIQKHLYSNNIQGVFATLTYVKIYVCYEYYLSRTHSTSSVNDLSDSDERIRTALSHYKTQSEWEGIPDLQRNAWSYK